MGAYSPVPLVDGALVDAVVRDAVAPTLHELARRGIAYRGVLYAGLMLTPAGPKVLEYNVRFGDPECEVVLPRLATDLGELCLAAATGRPLPEIRFHDDACVTVVLASEGYPAAPRTGDVIDGLDDAAAVAGAMVFHAGTRRRGGDLVTAGGRVLAVSALGRSVAEARTRAYDAAGRISWRGMQCRRDIAAGV
jgi:phosphoribosylamine--glycine ligase